MVVNRLFNKGSFRTSDFKGENVKFQAASQGLTIQHLPYTWLVLWAWSVDCNFLDKNQNSYKADPEFIASFVAWQRPGTLRHECLLHF